MKNKDYTILDNSHSQECYTCDGHGTKILMVEPDGTKYRSNHEKCETCNGTGLWVENHYILIDEKNKIAFDSDTGGN